MAIIHYYLPQPTIPLTVVNPADHWTDRAGKGLIYPDLLLNSQGILAHCVGHPDRDVFGYSAQAAGNFAERYLPEQSSTMAFHLACGPMYRLERAEFQVDYLRHLVEYDTHIVLEADWNM